MKYLKQLMILCVISLIGEGIANLFPFAIPGNILAMFILSLLLGTRLLKEQDIKEVSDYLLQVMGVFIVPIGAGIIQHVVLIRQVGVQLFIMCLVLLVISFLSCVFTIRLTTKMMTPNRNKEGH